VLTTRSIGATGLVPLARPTAYQIRQSTTILSEVVKEMKIPSEIKFWIFFEERNKNNEIKKSESLLNSLK
jgi:hypothetical protein